MRIDKLKKGLEENGLDVYLITDLNNVYYFTGFMDVPGTDLFLLVPLDGVPVLYVPRLSYSLAEEEADNCSVVEVRGRGRGLSVLIDGLRDLGGDIAGFDDLSASRFLKLKEKLQSTRFLQNQEVVWRLRRVKDGEEVALMKKAAELTDVGAEAGIEFLRAGVREYEVAAEIEYEMRRGGSRGVAFDTVVASGSRSRHPHGTATDRIIRNGDPVVMDLGAVYRGYRCDITRTVIVGTPSPREERVLKLLMRAQEEGFRAIRSGARARDVDSAARAVIEKEGFGKHFIHGLGHGVGLDIHEPPSLSSHSDEVLAEGNVVTDEPGIYTPAFGARIEDTVLVHERGGERLTRAAYFDL